MTIREARNIIKKNGYKIIESSLDDRQKELNRREGETTKLYNNLLNSLKSAIGSPDELWTSDTGWGEIRGFEWDDEQNEYIGGKTSSLEKDLLLYKGNNPEQQAKVIKDKYSDIFEKYDLWFEFDSTVDTILENNDFLKKNALSKEESLELFNKGFITNTRKN
jgi:hypothetical protein